MKFRCLIVTLFALLAACGPPSRSARPDDTQVVVQWWLPDRDGLFWSIHEMIWQNRIDNACGELCNFDGNDIGQGKLNLFLYTQDIPATVKMLVQLEKNGRLPAGMQIAAARYKDRSRKDWDYISLYPDPRKRFDL